MTSSSTSETRPDRSADGATLSPLPGEAGIPSVATRQRVHLSGKRLLAAALLLCSLVAVLIVTIQRITSDGDGHDGEKPQQLRDAPSAAQSVPRRLEMPAVAATRSASTDKPRIPALDPDLNLQAEDGVDPIGLRRGSTGAVAPTTGSSTSPADAPVMLVTARPGAQLAATAATVRRGTPPGVNEGPSWAGEATQPDPAASAARDLKAYQHRLQGLLDQLVQATSLSTTRPSGPASPGSLLTAAPGTSPAPAEERTSGGGLFGGQLQSWPARGTSASTLGDSSLTLPKGTAFTCALKTRVISASSGLVGCHVQRDIFGSDGRVLLIERGSHIDGEYRITSVRPGTVRIPVLWTRLRTPLGVIVDLDSPGTGPLGESGIDGHIDRRWSERIGAAMLLSLIDDSVKLIIQNQTSGAGDDGRAGTVILPATTAGTSKLAEKVLDSTINIPPLIYRNQGGVVGIYVARDLDFSSVYELRPTEADTASQPDAHPRARP